MSAQLILTSHSIDNVFDGCARKFEFLSLYDKRPARESGFAAQVGTCLHDATQAWLVAVSEGETQEQAIEKGYWELLKSYPFEEEYEQSAATRSFGRTVFMFRMIISHDSWDDWELVKVDGHGWAIEVPFLIKHTSLGEFVIAHSNVTALLATQGKIDFILKHKHIPNLYRTRDLKTTIIEEELERPEYEFSGQQIGYSNVLHAMLGDAQPPSFEVDYLVSHFNGNDVPVVNSVTIPMSQDKIDDYWLTKMDRLHRMKIFSAKGWFPRANGGCHGWGKPCAFFAICPTRDYELIDLWFEGINTEPQKGYDYWVTLEV